MKNTFGNHLTVTLFGESHGEAIGAVIDGVPSGIEVDMELLGKMMNRRRAKGKISTGRQEADIPQILSGVKDGYTEGTPIALVIANTNVHSSDYSALQNIARPSHADYSAYVRYNGFEDPRGGGHFSGRLTAPIVAAGALCMQMLHEKGIYIGTHIAKLKNIEDANFDETNLLEEIQKLNESDFPVLGEGTEEKMKALIEDARDHLDSVGGILDTAITGLEPGVGEPEFDSLESNLSHAMFSIPAIKGIEFGSGFGFADLYGSEANDPFRIEEGKVVTETNHNGGINGGISNGMPIRFRTVVKPTPSIAQKQKSVNFVEMKEVDIEIQGRHDPAIIHRAAVVVDAMCAITIVNALMEKYGTTYFGGVK